MKIQDEFIEYLSQFEIGKILTTSQIVTDINNIYGRNKSSIIPSDYCYNIINLDPVAYDFEKGHVRLLEQIAKGKYKYLGQNYMYNGTITHKGIVVGHWAKGKYFLLNKNY